MNAITTSRRGMIAALALAPVAVAIPATASTKTPFAIALERHQLAFNALNGAPPSTPYAEEERLGQVFMEAYDTLMTEPPQTAEDFVHKFLAIHQDGGALSREDIADWVKDARRLVA